MNGFVYLPDVVTLEFDQALCNGCKMCIHVCPHAVFGFRDKRAYLKNKGLCMECGACEMNCSQGAIKVKSGVGCAAGILNGLIRGTEPTCDCDGGGCC